MPFEVLIIFLGQNQVLSLLYPIFPLHYFRRMDAEEDVQDFGPFDPGLATFHVVVLFRGNPNFSAIEWSGIAKYNTFGRQFSK